MPNSRRHILLVEEHREIRAAFTSMFEHLYHYAVHTASATRDALAMIARQDVDLAVVDLTQPTELISRLAMIQSWRRDGRGFPVIATSAQDYDGLSIEAFAAGADDFLRKPYLLEEMRARIQRHLARRLDITSKRARIDGMALPVDPFTFASATIAPDMRITFPNGSTFKLSAKHVGILREFHVNAGTLVLKEKLIYAVWGSDANTNSTSVNQYLHVLRKLYRAGGVDLNAYIAPESKAGWRVAPTTTMA